MIGAYMDIVGQLGEYFSKDLTANQVTMYAEDLMVLSPEQLVTAIKIYRNDPSNKFFPLPSQLIGIITPTVTAIDRGRIVAGRIMTAIRRFGYMNVSEARAFIGELGWEVVKLQGGWKSLCELSSEAIKAEQPRWRDMAVTLDTQAKLGTLDQAPALPKSASEIKNINFVTNAIKSLGNGGSNGSK